MPTLGSRPKRERSPGRMRTHREWQETHQGGGGVEGEDAYMHRGTPDTSRYRARRDRRARDIATLSRANDTRSTSDATRVSYSGPMWQGDRRGIRADIRGDDGDQPQYRTPIYAPPFAIHSLDGEHVRSLDRASLAPPESPTNAGPTSNPDRGSNTRANAA